MLHKAGPAPFLRMAETATASVEAIMAEKSAPCCHSHPSLFRPKTYSRTGVKMAVLAMTMRKAKLMTWMSTCMHACGPTCGWYLSCADEHMHACRRF